MNEFIGVSIPKKDLKRTFDIIDRVKNGKIRLEEIKGIASLLDNEADGESGTDNLMGDEGEVMTKERHDLDELYE
jgi:hypothetical protein